MNISDFREQPQYVPSQNRNYMMDVDKLNGYMKRIWEVATAHGWHEQPLSMEHYMGLIMTEMAEAVEADRNDKRANTEAMADLLRVQAESEEGLSEHWYDMWYGEYYKLYVKGSIEEEFADVVIRILDMACERHPHNMMWHGYDAYGDNFRKDKSFVENAWYFLKEVLNYGTMNISDSVSYMYAWADHLGIDLDKHIEWKMKYNELRPYKHGGKKY